MVIRKPFHDLLDFYAQSKNLLLVGEIDIPIKGGLRIRPDGTLKDALRQDWGYWEAKDTKDHFQSEIDKKFAKGYPDTNILFEDTQLAILFQNGNEAIRAKLKEHDALDAILTQFVSYEPPEVINFHRAIKQFNTEVPALAIELRNIIEEQISQSEKLKRALNEFLEICQKAINPRVTPFDIREMIIQHILTEDVFMTVFDETQFHKENAIANKLQSIVDTFYRGATRHSIRARISPYYEIVNARASRIYNHLEKQKFLKALYENFYRSYNPKAADRLGVIYTPDEIVRFMIHSADHLAFKHFGKTLGDSGVEILDPATGTGTFITELIEYLPEEQLKHKYQNEIHCNELGILPYYIANLNIEYTYRQRMNEYLPFENICFVDTLDNMGFEKRFNHQLEIFAFGDDNARRIKRQNERRISVIIGNPPYNANQLNENENNKNREYPEIDKRIKETYIKNSTAQKTKSYDMYMRFLRWASDRLDKDGVIAFVSNNSFLDDRTHDGFRKVVANEFNHIYVIDLKGDARTSGERRRREGGNIFSDQIRVGVAIYFLVRKHGEKGCHIHYNAIADYTCASEKKDYLCNNTFTDLKFELIHPDRNNNWINVSENDWSEFIPVASKETKQAKTHVEQRAIFKLFSLGIITARDEWVYDENRIALEKRMKFLIDIYNSDVRKLRGIKRENVSDAVDYSIKWTRAVKNDLASGLKYRFDPKFIVDCIYRPFIKRKLYFDRHLNEMQYQIPILFPTAESENLAIAVNVGNNPFNVLAIDTIPDYHFNGDSQCLPLYRYNAKGERIENITDWALYQFHEHYHNKRITRKDIFYYVYAVLHHQTYRQKYVLNLKREFPRIPFYEDFKQWVKWGAALMDLHIKYETAKPYRLKREEKKAKDLRQPVTPRLIARKESGVIEVDTLTTLSGIPAEAWQYRLGTYSALEWIIERYKERKIKDPTIREKFNTYRFADHKEYVINLLKKVCTVSVETMKIISQMPK